MFNKGQIATVTQTIVRADGKSSVYPGETVEILSVYQGSRFTIVDIKPLSGKAILTNVCCSKEGPLK